MVAEARHGKVLLAAGEYYTGPIVVEGFEGYFEGAGMDETIIHNVSGLDVGEISFFNEPTAAAPWPVLITFSGGDVKISDMRFQIDDPEPIHWTYGAWDSYAFYGLVMITGENINSKVERVAFKGKEVSPGFLGYNVGNPLLITSHLNMPWGVSGTHGVYSCTFNDLGNTVAVACIGDANVTIGGSALKGNIFENVYYGCEIDDVSGCNVEISYNQFINIGFAGIYSKQGYFYNWVYEYPPETSDLMIKYNTIETGDFAYGIELYDFSARFAGNKRINAQVLNNNIYQPGNQIGIYTNGLQGGMFNSNVLTGSALIGSYIAYGSNGCSIVNNDYENMETDLADVMLTGSTFNNLVVCGRYETEVVDYGTDNETLCPAMDRGPSINEQDMDTFIKLRRHPVLPNSKHK